METNDENGDENIEEFPATTSDLRAENYSVDLLDRNEAEAQKSNTLEMAAGKSTEKTKKPKQARTGSDDENAVKESINEICCSDEGEEDEEDDEMSEDDIQGMFNAARAGDIDWLEELLDKPFADINITWYSENLLMAAIRGRQEKMAEFLLDNGINQNYNGRLIDLKENETRIIEWYTRSCRQMAYDQNMMDIVELIDIMNNEHFGYIKPAPRTPRLRRVRPPSTDTTDSHTDNPDLLPQLVTSLTDADSLVQNKLMLPGEMEGVSARMINIDAPKIDTNRRHSRLSIRSTNVDALSEKQSSVISSPRDKLSRNMSAEVILKSENRRDQQLDDDGYGSMSRGTSTPVSPSPKPYFQKSSGFVLYCRPTKAFMSHRRETERSLLKKQTACEETPKINVNSVGSYSMESRFWHDETAEKRHIRLRAGYNHPGSNSERCGTVHRRIIRHTSNVPIRHSACTFQNRNRQQNAFPHSSYGMYNLYANSHSITHQSNTSTPFGPIVRPFSSPAFRSKSVGRISSNNSVFSKRARPKTSISLELHSNWKK